MVDISQLVAEAVQLLVQNRYEEGLKLVEPHLTEASTEGMLWILKGTFQAHLVPRGKASKEEAKKHLDRGRELAPVIPQVYDILGTAYRAAGLWQESVDAFERLEELSPGAVNPGEIASVRYKLEQSDLAQRNVEKAAEQGFEAAGDATNAAWQLMEQGELEQALEYAEKATDMAPRDLQAWLYLGEIRHALELYKEGLQAGHRAVELAPDAANSWIVLGKNYSGSKYYLGALGCYARALVIDETRNDLWISIGKAYLDLNDPSRALAAWMLSQERHDYEEMVQTNIVAMLGQGIDAADREPLETGIREGSPQVLEHFTDQMAGVVEELAHIAGQKGYRIVEIGEVIALVLNEKVMDLYFRNQFEALYDMEKAFRDPAYRDALGRSPTLLANRNVEIPAIDEEKVDEVRDMVLHAVDEMGLDMPPDVDFRLLV